MSLLTSLAYAITAAVRPRVRDAEVAALQAQVDDLNRKADNLLADMTRQRDGWQALALSYRREVMEQRTPAQMLQAQAARYAAQQTNQAQAQQQQYSMLQNGPYIAAAQYGMQGFGQQLDEYVRNCTPGRHELFMRG